MNTPFAVSSRLHLPGAIKRAHRVLLPCLLGSSFAIGVAASDDEPPGPKMTQYWSPQPTVVTAAEGQIPSDAIVLFDGTSLDAWETALPDQEGPAPWHIENGLLIVNPKSGAIRTLAEFGDVQLHLGWRAPFPVTGNGQKRGNSGVFFMGRYEVQILDSFENRTYVNGGASSVYKQYPPLVNATRPPGQWQTYDIIFIAPRFDASGRLLSPAKVTVFHNGVLTQHAVELGGPTEYRGLPRYTFHVPRLPLVLQEHGDPVAFRNIWIRELNVPSTTFTP